MWTEYDCLPVSFLGGTYDEARRSLHRSWYTASPHQRAVERHGFDVPAPCSTREVPRGFGVVLQILTIDKPGVEIAYIAAKIPCFPEKSRRLLQMGHAAVVTCRYLSKYGDDLQPNVVA